MAKFLTGNELNLELEKIFETSEDELILVSPYIKLHDRYASALKTKLNNEKLQITVVFGKNEEDLSKSMKQEDFLIFKKFPNIQIRYEKCLHAKYYANESTAILTSMNLYSYSQDNNIEAGVMTKTKLFGSESLDNDAFDYFGRVIEQSEILFHKVPEYESTMMGLSKKYKGSKVEVDKLSDFFANNSKYESTSRKNSNKVISMGFCIRTGVSIPFNLKKPMSYEAYKSWSKDPDYAEKFCHFSGEQSNGETSVNSPILKKNWKKAKEIFDL
jgi:hypothetical protein